MNHEQRHKIIADHILSIAEPGDFGICSPPMDAQIALNELCRYFLGDDWYSTMSQSSKQINTEIIYAIECNYKGDRKTWKTQVDKYKKKG